MTFRDYFHLFSTVSQQAESHDYFLHFIETPVPDLQRYPELTKICDWAAYDDHSFRLWTSLPLDEFEQRFAEIVPLPSDSYQLDYSYNLQDTNFF